MAQYNFEGDIDNVTERQLEYINSVIIEHGFVTAKVTFAPVGKPGDNYMATVKRITVEGNDETLTMIAKIAPTHEMLRALMNAHVVFNNEHTLYTKVLPKLIQLQKDADVPEHELLKHAKCYGTFNEEPNEVILLEDLKTLDYAMLDRFVPLSNDCVKSVLKNFAVYHSLSFALKNKEPALYEEFRTTLIDLWSIPDPTGEMKKFLQTLENDTIGILDNQDHINLIKNKIVGSSDVAIKLTKADNNSKYSVIVQGDCWTNNIMFKTEEGKDPSSIMIDYQLAKNTSPVYDLMYMLFNCTDYESRKEHFYDWIDYYHSELEKSLSNYNLKSNYVFPRDKLDADLKRYGKLLFGVSIIVASVLIRKSEDAAKMMDLMKADNIMQEMQDFGVVQLDNESKELFKTKVTGLIQSFIDFGLM